MKLCVALTIAAASLLSCLQSLRADEPSYARPDLLIEADRLVGSRIIDSKYADDFTILDARPQTDYLRGHVYAALWVNHDEWAKTFDHGQDAEGWSRRIGSLGIGSKTKVVVYDNSLSKDAARIWWILRFWGVEDVRLLNGGLKAWERMAKPLGWQKETTARTPVPTDFVARPRSERLATKQQLLKSLSGGKLQIVDARSESEFCDLQKMSNKRAGAIPGATPLEWVDLIDKKSGRFKSAGELARLFGSAGIRLDRPAVARCQSGGRASVMAFGLELMGAKEVSNYYASWAEWSRADDTPVIPGQPRKKD
jgi:thiosulfate/3-mercaptopyruvate sulfurtransferase